MWLFRSINTRWQKIFFLFSDNFIFEKIQKNSFHFSFEFSIFIRFFFFQWTRYHFWWNMNSRFSLFVDSGLILLKMKKKRKSCRIFRMQQSHVSNFFFFSSFQVPPKKQLNFVNVCLYFETKNNSVFFVLVLKQKKPSHSYEIWSKMCESFHFHFIQYCPKAICIVCAVWGAKNDDDDLYK